MDKLDIYVWLGYVTFVVIGLAIFVGISSYIRNKLHICEEEHKEIYRREQEESKNIHKTGTITEEYKKESFSLFSLLGK